MTTPKFKECPFSRHARLGRKKPHVYWDAGSGEWLYAFSGSSDTARNLCIAQDDRWTPRDKS